MIHKATNVVWQETKVSKEDRKILNGHSSFILWFTGLSGAGKSTIATAVERRLFDRGLRTYLLDGDNVRHGLNHDLGFSDEDRIENIRRVGEVSKLMVDSGMIVLSAFISPFQSDRDMVRNLVSENEFFEVFVNCPLLVCEERDPKGLYEKARRGEISNFTGIDSEYELPKNPDIEIATDQMDVDACIQSIIDFLDSKNLLSIKSATS